MRRIALIAAAFAALAPATANAATATTADGKLRYVAAGGEVNNVSFARVSGDTFRVTELGATITAGSGCTQESPNVVRCTTQAGRPIIANLGDQNDRATSRTSRSVELYGEDGNDRLTGASGRDTLDGGSGDDNLSGGSGGDRIRGGDGNDTLTGGAGNDSLQGGGGNDFLDGGTGSDSESGGDGDDTLREGSAPNGADSLDGGSGNDTVDYGARTAPVFVSIDDIRDDGDRRSAERDNVRSTIDRVIGGTGSDTLIGRDGPSDTLVGGAGDDVIDPRRGDDRVDGGPGIDQISLRDLSADDVVCGDGVDSVAADARDTTAPDCENARRTVSMGLSVSEPAIYPTVNAVVSCPRSAFKGCAGRVILRTLTKVRTNRGATTLTLAARRFTAQPGESKRLVIRIRAGARRYMAQGRLTARATLSAYDGAGPARRAADRFQTARG